jgi:hypothetical protein
MTNDEVTVDSILKESNISKKAFEEMAANQSTYYNELLAGEIPVEIADFLVKYLGQAMINMVFPGMPNPLAKLLGGK